jgi:hypothetical protein
MSDERTENPEEIRIEDLPPETIPEEEQAKVKAGSAVGDVIKTIGKATQSAAKGG